MKVKVFRFSIGYSCYHCKTQEIQDEINDFLKDKKYIDMRVEGISMGQNDGVLIYTIIYEDSEG